MEGQVGEWGELMFLSVWGLSSCESSWPISVEVSLFLYSTIFDIWKCLGEVFSLLQSLTVKYGLES